LGVGTVSMFSLRLQRPTSNARTAGAGATRTDMETMSIGESVQRALPILATSGRDDFDGMVAALRRAGFTKAVAADLVEFMPLAFARVLFEGTGVRLADHYVRTDGNARERKRGLLMDEPVYRASMAAAQDVIARDEETFVAVAARSSELQALNKALQSGSRLENVFLGEPTLEWSSRLHRS
jgi:hypothetical protein